MQSRPEELYLDTVEHPEKYDDAVPALVRDMVEKRRPPTAEERLLLDAAVLDFAAKAKPVAAGPKKPASPRVKSPEAEETMSSSYPGEPKPFWWL